MTPKISSFNKKQIFSSLENPFVYSGVEYGLSPNLNGANVKCLLIDSGKPNHKDINPKSETKCFYDKNKNIYDEIGHSTIVSGIISGNGTIKGFAPKTTIYFAKVCDNKGKIRFNSLVVAILWGIAKKVDCILLPLATTVNFPILHDSIKKAHENNIIVISPGNFKNNSLEYPGQYQEVISVGTRKHKDILRILSKPTMSCFLDNKYIETSGTSISSAIVCGLTCLKIEEFKKRNVKSTSSAIKANLSVLFA